MTPYNTGRVKIGQEFCVNPFFKAPPVVGDAFLLQGALLKRERPAGKDASYPTAWWVAIWEILVVTIAAVVLTK
jgi:hypothetical protein